jgi:hypothetical protein
MSSGTTEQIIDNSSLYEILNSCSSNTNPTTVNLNDLINRIISIVNERLDDAQQYKTTFRNNSMQPAVYQILCEMKNKIGKTNGGKKPVTSRLLLALNTQQLPSIDNQPSEQLIRIDNMLIAEGISEQNSSTHLLLTNNSLDYTDYQTKLSRIRQIYKFELEKYENHCNDFCSHVVTLLREQSQIRPISEREIQRMVLIIRKKFSIIQLQLKQSTCEAVMVLRSRFLDAR